MIHNSPKIRIINPTANTMAWNSFALTPPKSSAVSSAAGFLGRLLLTMVTLQFLQAPVCCRPSIRLWARPASEPRWLEYCPYCFSKRPSSSPVPSGLYMPLERMIKGGGEQAKPKKDEAEIGLEATSSKRVNTFLSESSRLFRNRCCCHNNNKPFQ